MGPTLCTLLTAWAQIGLEDTAAVPSASLATSIERLRKGPPKLGCGCSSCIKVYDFLVNNKMDAIMKLEGLPASGGENTLKHVQQNLKAFVTSDIATWTAEHSTAPGDNRRDLWVSGIRDRQLHTSRHH